MLRTVEQRQVLAELELTSTSRAHAFASYVTGSASSSSAPNGDESPADYWRRRFDDADPSTIGELVELARKELKRILRRPFPALAYDSADELAARVLDEGEGFEALELAYSLRCTPTFVRRARLAAGREPERGRAVRPELTPDALLAAGMSYRQVEAVLGVPRSTMHAHHARAV